MSSAAPVLQSFIQKNYIRRKWKDRFICFLLILSAAIALFPLFSVLSCVIVRGLPSLGPSFFTELPKPVGEVGGGMANALLGTLIMVGIASLIGVGWGVSVGVYLSEYGKGKLGTIVRFTCDLLASVPSIVIGLFVYATIVKTMGTFSAFAGGLALSILMIPIVARSTEEMLKLVPQHIREAGLALGLPRWKVIVRVVVRGSFSAILTGVMLAVARVAGETAPLLFTALNNQYWSTSLLQPIGSLPVQIYTYAISPFEDWHRQAWAAAMVLVLVVFTMNLMTRLVFAKSRS